MVTEDPIRDNVVPTFSILENMALVGLDPIYRHGDMALAGNAQSAADTF